MNSIRYVPALLAAFRPPCALVEPQRTARCCPEASEAGNWCSGGLANRQTLAQTGKPALEHRNMGCCSWLSYHARIRACAHNQWIIMAGLLAHSPRATSSRIGLGAYPSFSSHSQGLLPRSSTLIGPGNLVLYRIQQRIAVVAIASSRPTILPPPPRPGTLSNHTRRGHAAGRHP